MISCLRIEAQAPGTPPPPQQARRARLPRTSLRWRNVWPGVTRFRRRCWGKNRKRRSPWACDAIQGAIIGHLLLPKAEASSLVLPSCQGRLGPIRVGLNKRQKSSTGFRETSCLVEGFTTFGPPNFPLTQRPDFWKTPPAPMKSFIRSSDKNPACRKRLRFHAID